MTELLTTTPLHPGNVTVFGLLVVVLVLLARLGWIAIDLSIDAMRRHNRPTSQPLALTAVMDATREVPEEAEPSWPGKAPLLRPVLGASGRLSETASETSGRHARVDPDDAETGLMPAVDDEAALAVVAAVSGQDGAS